jgi:hypothetical protein
MHIRWDRDELWFTIEEAGTFYPPAYRSKGKQWHIAFYIRVTARSKDPKNDIILIDEPGLYLHAKAQEDVLRKLEDVSKVVPVIFTTHSPYLLPYDKLERIRLVEKKDRDTGTKVENKIHKMAGADKETLTPIITAIGLEMASSIGDIDKKNNVICEGPADWYYLEAFKLISGDNLNVNFVYGGGAGNVGIVGAILTGWGCDVIYLFDNDKGKKDGEKNLIDNWLVAEDVIYSVTDVEGGRIEDVFTKEDFAEFVLGEPGKEYKSKNSTYIKKGGKDPVLKAKLFLELCRTGKPSLSKESERKIEALLGKIQKAFE